MRIDKETLLFVELDDYIAANLTEALADLLLEGSVPQKAWVDEWLEALNAKSPGADMRLIKISTIMPGLLGLSLALYYQGRK